MSRCSPSSSSKYIYPHPSRRGLGGNKKRAFFFKGCPYFFKEYFTWFHWKHRHWDNLINHCNDSLFSHSIIRLYNWARGFLVSRIKFLIWPRQFSNGKQLNESNRHCNEDKHQRDEGDCVRYTATGKSDVFANSKILIVDKN